MTLSQPEEIPGQHQLSLTKEAAMDEDCEHMDVEQEGMIT